MNYMGSKSSMPGRPRRRRRISSNCRNCNSRSRSSSAVLVASICAAMAFHLCQHQRINAAGSARVDLFRRPVVIPRGFVVMVGTISGVRSKRAEHIVNLWLAEIGHFIQHQPPVRFNAHWLNYWLPVALHLWLNGIPFQRKFIGCFMACDKACSAPAALANTSASPMSSVSSNGQPNGVTVRPSSVLRLPDFRPPPSVLRPPSSVLRFS